jgi:hypothetical protein
VLADQASLVYPMLRAVPATDRNLSANCKKHNPVSVIEQLVPFNILGT